MLNFRKIAEHKGWQEPIQDKDFFTYHAALKLYWQADYQGCVAYTSALLVQGIQRAEVQPYLIAYYRLWAECLKAENALASLRLLAQHLLREFHDLGAPSAGAQAERVQDVRALRALIHFSLDEQQACELLAAAISPQPSSPYTLEFFSALHARGLGEGRFEAVSLVASEGLFCDYFQWQSLAEELAEKKQSAELADVLHFVARYYPGSPLLLECKARQEIEKKQWQQGLDHAKLLQNRFPRKREYYFLTAYCCRNLGLWQAALENLQTQATLFKEGDPDLYAELGYCSAQLADHSSTHAVLALQYYEKAEKKYRALGLAYTHLAIPQQELRTLLEKDKAEEPSAGTLKYWLVNLSQRRYLELQTGLKKDYEVVFCSLGAQAKKNDLVFFAVTDQTLQEEERWRLVAIYYAGADTVAHPLNHWQTPLKLVKNIEFPLFLYFHSEQLPDRRKRKRPTDPAAYGAYELDAEAFSQIAAQIEEVAQGRQDSDTKVVLRRVS